MEEFIRDFLKNNGFNEEDNVWVLNKEYREQGSIININGQTFNQPGSIINIKYEIDIMGDGYMEDLDGDNREEFTIAQFSIYKNKVKVREFCECFNKGDESRFNEIIKSVLK